MADKYKLKVRTRIDGKSYASGSVVELDERLKQTQQVKDLFENDYLKLVEEDTSEEQEIEDVDVEFDTNKVMDSEPIDKSFLTSIPGIGSFYADKVIEKFESVEALKEASVEEIAKVQGLSKSLAEEIKEKL